MKIKICLTALILWAAFAGNGIAEDNIGALGRIKPKGGIVDLAGPAGDTIAEITVQEGETVKKGTCLVVFQSRETYELEADMARIAAKEADDLGSKSIALQKARVREADELGAGAISIQRERIQAAASENEFALKRLKRFQQADGKSISEQMMDERENHVRVSGSKLDSAGQELSRLVLDREIRVSQARLELERLILNREINMERTRKQLELAMEKLEHASLNAPMEGTVLEVLQSVGEATGGRPIIRMADLENMYVIAEVFEGDLLRISPGMKATVTGNALPKPLTGEVESIGRIINPANRTADVKVRLYEPAVASKLINLEVDVSIAY
ncbi:MAG: efflux RND transporter periplasmic adaptor subunit [Deltaproteobacteria bacterium]|nr:efflux RND transporter periplasmic adaptor subunit [Deltaproteobacteria bacterium]